MTLPDAVDIVIVNYRSTDDTLAALAAITPWLRGQILLVDNSEDASELEHLSNAVAVIPGVRMIVPERNLGFGEGCNLAFGQSTAEFVLLLNPDARIDPHHIAMLVEALKSDPGLAGVSPKTFWDTTARREGLLGLEAVAELEPDAFARDQGHQLALGHADGFEHAHLGGARLGTD